MRNGIDLAIARLEQAIARVELRIEQLNVHLNNVHLWQGCADRRRLEAELAALRLLEAQYQELLPAAQQLTPTA